MPTVEQIVKMPQSKPCVFCDIIAGKSETTIAFSNENIVIFKDIRPASDHHYLAVPKTHIHNVRSLNVTHKELSMLTTNFVICHDKNDFNHVSTFDFLVLEMKEQLAGFLSELNVNLDDVSYGFHWPPCTSIDHLHMHAIAPASKMGFVARLIFKPINMWYCSVSNAKICGKIDNSYNLC